MAIPGHSRVAHIAGLRPAPRSRPAAATTAAQAATIPSRGRSPARPSHDGLGARFALRGSTTAFRPSPRAATASPSPPASATHRRVHRRRARRELCQRLVPDHHAAVRRRRPGLRAWTRIDRHELTGAIRGGPTAAVGVGPTEALDLIARAGATVRAAGRERARGVRTRRYRATLPFGRYLDGAAGRRPAGLPGRHPRARYEPPALDRRRRLSLRRARLRLASPDLSIAVTMDVTGYDRGPRSRSPARRTHYDADERLCEARNRKDEMEKVAVRRVLIARAGTRTARLRTPPPPPGFALGDR